jgi:hypothetical protein
MIVLKLTAEGNSVEVVVLPEEALPCVRQIRAVRKVMHGQQTVLRQLAQAEGEPPE